MTRPSGSHPRFAHPVERELAGLLDEHGVRWQYEPHFFPLERRANGRVAEGVTPDFYLPDLDIYIECTVMREPTRKNRKVRKLRERYDIVVTVLDRRDFLRLSRRYGLGTRIDVLVQRVGDEGDDHRTGNGRHAEKDDPE